jgi:lipopolysaccharide transport system permease protein
MMSRTIGPETRGVRWPLLGPLHLVWRHRLLAWEMGKRDLQVVNKGTVLGFSWLFIRPFVQVAAYVFVVSVIFGVRFGPDGDSRFSYAVYVLSGMIPWQLMTMVLEEAPSLIRRRIELLKQVVYPLELLPVTTMMVAAVGPMVSLGVYFLLAGASGTLQWSVLLLPIPVLMLMALLIGSAWLLMVAGTLLVDLREIVGVTLSLLVYMSPVVLFESAVPAPMWHVLEFNPLFHVVICFRDVFTGQLHALSWAIFGGMTAVAVVLGSFAVSRAKQIFAELL